MSQSRQLAAIMFTDIVGYTASMQENEQKAVALIKHYNAALNHLVDLHAGKVLNYYGDGSLCTFTSVTEAVNCAMVLQKDLQSEPNVPLRIGLHVGEIFFEEDKALGDGVNMASRIQSLGQANTILFSKEIFDKIKNHPEIKAVSLGLFEFKNVDEPMEVFALANEGLVIPKREEMSGKLKKDVSKSKTTSFKNWMNVALVILLLLIAAYFIKSRFINKTTDRAKENSIAVLYFNNMSGDSAQEYFSDGITEEITARLSKIGGLKVKSRTSVLQYKNQTKNAKLIAQELGVNNILEGSVRKQGDKVVITTQLINGETDEHIWSVTYNRELKDIFEVQSDIAQQIAKKFQIKLSEATKKKLVTPPTLNTVAYDLYLKATPLSKLETPGSGGKQPNRQKAITLLIQAIQLDPSFSDAYALLSLNYATYSTDAEHPKHWLDSATILAGKAIDLSPDRESGYIAMANVKNWEGHYDESLRWLLKAHEIIPFSTAGNIASNYLAQNDYGKAYGWLMRSMEYDPEEPAYYASEAWLYFSLGLLDSMKNCIDRARRINIESSAIDYMALHYYWFTGNYEEYTILIKKMSVLDEKEFANNMGIFYLFQREWRKADSCYAISSQPAEIDAGLVKIHLGKKEQGRSYLEKAIQTRMRFLGFNTVWHNHDISRAYAALQDKRYIEYFDKALERGWHYYPWIEQDPFFDLVRETTEFKKLRQKIYERNERFKADLYKSIERYNKEKNN